MTDHPASSAAVPQQRPSTDQIDQRAAALRTLAHRSAPRTPPGAAAVLTDQVLLHTSADTGRLLLPMLPDEIGGLVLRGSKAGAEIKLLRKGGYERPLVLDAEAYRRAAATAEEPFILAEDGLFPISLEQDLQGQRVCGATVALTPTGYLYAGDSDALRAAASAAAAIDRDDVVFSIPLDVAWLTDEFIDHVIAVLAPLDLPKALFLGAQYDPVTRYKEVAVNLRRLYAEVAHVAPLRTDLTGFDALSHGAFATSIGSGGSLRHIVPVDENPQARTKDRSPSVLYGDLLSFHKGSTLAKRFANTTPPACGCPPCRGRHLDSFLLADDAPAAHQHNVSTWGPWIAELRAQGTLADRATWWRNRCAAAIAQAEIVNAQISQPKAFKPPVGVRAWAELPVWLTASRPVPRRSRAR